MFNELACFLLFRCSGACEYCIQQGIDRKSRGESDPKKWIDFLLSSDFKGGKLSLIGGEPTLYKGFKEIVEAVHDKYLVTTTTNLKSPLFKDIGEFLSWAINYRVRWNLSYHPSVMSVSKFIEMVYNMRLAGLWVDQVASVHTKGIEPHIPELCRANIGFSLQCPTWIDQEDTLHPTEEELFKYGSGEAMIDEYDRYELSFFSSCYHNR